MKRSKSRKLSRSQCAQLRAARIASKLTMLQLASALGVDPATIGRWERREVGPSRHVLPVLAARFPEIFPPSEVPS